MSSIFSDPFFRRGATLLGGETIEYSDAPTNSKPIAGTEIVGQVKVFQDVEPTGTQKRLSNRLVYCVAARYTGTTVTDASTIAGELFLFDPASPLSEFSTKATSTNATVGQSVGVLDEYLGKIELRKNDIVWLVVKGPTKIKRTGTAIASGATIQPSSTGGQTVVYSSGVPIAQQIGDGGDAGAAVALVRVNMHSDDI
jgi:hypothetical protein